MDVIRIEGGHPVGGTVTVEGAKNSALKLMAATIMAPGVTTLRNVPNIADVHVSCSEWLLCNGRWGRSYCL